jgi:hypothetical protein
MTPEMRALARRVVACRGWRWMEGMATETDGCSNRVVEVEVNDHWGYGMESVPVCMAHRLVADSNCSQWREHDVMPDLTDPATLGCLLALVREAHAVLFLQVSVKISREHGYQFDCHPHHRGQWVDSEAEALVAALEDAP